MFMFHNAQMMALIALALGVLLVVWSKRNQGAGVALAITFGWIIIVLSILSIVCNGYYAMKMWRSGYMPSHMCVMQDKAMNDTDAKDKESKKD